MKFYVRSRISRSFIQKPQFQIHKNIFMFYTSIFVFLCHIFMHLHFFSMPINEMHLTEVISLSKIIYATSFSYFSKTQKVRASWRGCLKCLNRELKTSALKALDIMGWQRIIRLVESKD